VIWHRNVEIKGIFGYNEQLFNTKGGALVKFQKFNVVLALTLVLSVFILQAVPAQAHPANFRILTDIQEHIDFHADNLRAMLAEDGAVTPRVESEYAEILEHALEYRNMAAKLGHPHLFSEVAPTVEDAARRMFLAAGTLTLSR